MGSLVDETTRALQMVADVDLEAACGEAFKVPKDSEECTAAMGTRSVGYTLLSSTLDKWAPYL